MTNQDKINISKIDMIRVRVLQNKLAALNERYKELGLCTQGSGIDYSKDRIQTSPSNSIEALCVERADEISEYYKIMEEIYRYHDIVNKLPADLYNVIINLDFNGLSYRRYANKKNKTVSSIQRLHNRALIEYFNHKI